MAYSTPILHQKYTFYDSFEKYLNSTEICLKPYENNYLLLKTLEEFGFGAEMKWGTEIL